MLIRDRYSIAYGLIAGIVTYIIMNTVAWVLEKISGGRIVPPEKNLKEHWTYKLEGGLLPPWVTRAAKGKKDFWRPYDDEEHNASGRIVEGTDHGVTGKTTESQIGEVQRDKGSESDSFENRRV